MKISNRAKKKLFPSPFISLPLLIPIVHIYNPNCAINFLSSTLLFLSVTCYFKGRQKKGWKWRKKKNFLDFSIHFHFIRWKIYSRRVAKSSNNFFWYFSSRSSLQSLLIARLSAEWEAQATPNTNDIYVSPAEGARACIPRDSLSRHLYARGNRHENRPHRSESAGEFSPVINSRFSASEREKLEFSRMCGEELLPMQELFSHIQQRAMI